VCTLITGDVHEELIELVCSDRELLRAEFSEIIAANWECSADRPQWRFTPGGTRPPGADVACRRRTAPRDPSADPTDTGGGATAPAPRQRSPPALGRPPSDPRSHVRNLIFR